MSFFAKILLSAEVVENLNEVCDCSDHAAIILSVDCSVVVSKTLLKNFRSFGSVGNAGVENTMNKRRVEAVWFTKIYKMCHEFYNNVDQLFVEHVSLKSRHRQILCSGIISSNSNLLECLKSQKGIPAQKETGYRKLPVTQLENSVAEGSEKDRKAHQEALMSTRNIDAVLKNLTSLNGSQTLPVELACYERTCKDNQQKAGVLKEFFHSVFSPT